LSNDMKFVTGEYEKDLEGECSHSVLEQKFSERAKQNYEIFY